MNNLPNMYRITYSVMEGDNYAGGWAERSCDVKALGDVIRFRNIKSVVPIFVEVGEPISDAEIQEAVNQRKQEILYERKLADIRAAEEQLKRAKAALDK